MYQNVQVPKKVILFSAYPYVKDKNDSNVELITGSDNTYVKIHTIYLEVKMN